MSGERMAFFDPTTVAMLRNVLEDAWSRLPPGQTGVTRSLLAERILKAAKTGERVRPAFERARSQRWSISDSKAAGDLRRLKTKGCYSGVTASGKPML
jgi:hypothetical protein